MAKKKKPAAEIFRAMLEKNPNITAQTAIDRIRKKGYNKVSKQAFYDTRSRWKKKQAATTPAQPARGSKAAQIRELIKGNPKITLAEAKEQLDVTSSQFYSQRRIVLGKKVAARKAAKTRKARQQAESEDMRTDYVQLQVELELMKQQNAKYKAVIAALL
jgi:hypothetical protein